MKIDDNVEICYGALNGKCCIDSHIHPKGRIVLIRETVDTDVLIEWPHLERQWVSLDWILK